jgi:rhodanese-related sulfurtransferase
VQRLTVDDLLSRARERLTRLEPAEAMDEIAQRGALLVDIRSEAQREADGIVPHARFIPRNVLEWRFDPDCPYRDPAVSRLEARIVLMCNEGYQSSLAAATLQDMGFDGATDLAGGFQAWRRAGLPVERGPAARPR